MKAPFTPSLLPHQDVKWEPLIPLIGQANRALALYDGVLYGVPNPEVLLSPLTTQEAVLSSKIEGTQATLGDVLKFDAGEEPRQEARRQDIQEIINYREALRSAERELKTRPFNLNLLLKLHSILLDSVRGRDKGRGKFRTVQNWIGPPGTPIEEAAFIPPPPQALQGLLDNWEKYYHMDRPDPLVQLAVVHAQFEIIHPFVDGNGRLGRILIPLFLAEKELLSQPMFYLSAYLDAHRDQYVSSLRALGTHKDSWNDWIQFFLTALIEQAKLNAAKARSIMDLYEKMKTRVITLTHSQFAVPLLDALFEQPILKSSALDGRPGMPSKPMVMALLAKLKQEKILRVIRPGSGRRAQILLFSDLIDLCEASAVQHKG
ncbi:MAG TPA: Fic/DOC family N-terminal domain-containing protein [Steroidobacteraceae bacterium]|nr:Fic/DOC family N-terminal domain-containing protein [Steroidobacteraceae bacterium]